MIVSGFGYGMETFGGWEDELPYHQIVSFAASRVFVNSESAVVSTAEYGWEMALVEACLHLGIPTMVLIPFEGYQLGTNNFWRSRYNFVLENSPVVKVMSDLKPHSLYDRFTLLQNTKDWIFDYIKSNSGKLYSLWDGSKDDNIYKIRQADRMGIEVLNFWKELNKGLNRSLTL